MHGLVIDIITHADSAALQDLATSVGWTFTPEQAKLFLSAAGTLFGHRLDGRLVSSAGIYVYGSTLASLGLVIVHPDFQRQGLGRRMVQRCLNETEQTGVPAILVATAQGFPLYTSLGFRTIGSIHRFVRDKSPDHISFTTSGEASPIRADDVRELIAIDQMAVGARRDELYRVLFSMSEHGYVIRSSQNSIEGFGPAVHRNNVLVVGPLIASTTEIAMQLVAKFASSWDGPIRFDVPNQQASFIAELAKAGFKETLVSPLMIRRADGLPGQRQHLFAIVDPALG